MSLLLVQHKRYLTTKLGSLPREFGLLWKKSLLLQSYHRKWMLNKKRFLRLSHFLF